MGVRIIRDKNRIPQILAKLDRLHGTTIKAGVLGQGQTQYIAGIQEFGVSIAVTAKMRAYLASQGLFLKKSTTYIHIPERSFIRAGWDENENDVLDKSEEFLKDAFVLNISAQSIMDAMGQEARDVLKDYARDLRDPANHPFTIRQKASSNPLVDSGNMIHSIDYEIL